MDKKRLVDGTTALAEKRPRVIKIEPAERPQNVRLRVAAYTRVSSDSEDQLNSFAAQNRYYTELISGKAEWRMVDIYADEGITGTSVAKRDDFQRMMADCRRGLIDQILVKSISRFARNTKDCLQNIRELKELGVNVRFEREGIDTVNVSSELITAIYAAFAQKESESISGNMRWSYQRRMESGTFLPSSMAYGYRLDGKKIVIDPEAALIVSRIFQWYLSGVNKTEIAKRLNEEGVPSGQQKQWYAAAVRYILTNEKYTGDSLWQKTYTSHTLPATRYKNTGEYEQFYAMGTHPPIISKEAFEQAQQLAQKRKSTYGKKLRREPYPLSQKISCGHCGSSYRRKEQVSSAYWCCRKHDTSVKDCPIAPVAEESLYGAFCRLYYKLKHQSIPILEQNLPTPTAIYHTEVTQPTALQQQMVQELSERAAKVHAGSVDASTDNMLKITSDGRKLGLDQRVINPDLPDDPNSKVNLCVNNIHRIWQDGQAEKLTQLVFCDLSTPKGKAAQSGRIAAKGTDSPELHALEAAIDAETEPEEPPFTIYDDIREKLVARGIPREQIAFIHEANTEVRKKELFAKVRSGQVRVLMGSTFKMGAGMNVQDRLVALHDLDCPWRPGDLEQRSGRIIRQGNRNKEVHIYRYVTESTFDAYLWQTVENKQKFISQIMTSKSPVRSCEDIDEAALSYAEIKALCAGDERIREKMDLDVDVARLRLMKANHQSQQYRLEDNILRHFPAQIEENKGFLSGFEADMRTLEAHPHPKDGFAGMEVKGDFLTDKDNAGAAILEAFKDAKGLESVPIGTYRGFSMSLTVENFGKDFILTLKGRMSHRVELGKDARGNLVRIDNALAQMPERYKTVQGRLENVQAQLATAKAELGKPFPQEAELKEKSARLAELNAELNIDDRTPMEQAAENVVAKRPSVLGKLKAPCVHGAGERKKSHEQEAR